MWEAAAQQIRSQRTEDLLLYCVSLLGSRARANVALREHIQQQLQAHLNSNRNVEAQMYAVSSAVADQCSGKNGVDGSYRKLSLAQETWILWGKEDGVSDRCTCEAIARMTNAKIIAVDTGHYFAWEDPRRTGEELKKILDP
jgi:pimeloyl-ACP methyl ester carboxylesterase